MLFEMMQGWWREGDVVPEAWYVVRNWFASDVVTFARGGGDARFSGQKYERFALLVRGPEKR